MKGVFLALDVKGATYDPSNSTDGCRDVLYRTYKTGTAKRSGLRKSYASRDSFDKFEMSANNLRAAAKKVDNSAAAVEVALKQLLVA